MEAINKLREAARDKRDLAMKKVREDYDATLRRIAALEQDLLGKEPPTHKSASACIEMVLPDDRAFTVSDILIELELLDPSRPWRKRTVDSHISRMREKGLVRRIRKSRNNKPVYTLELASKLIQYRLRA